MKTITGKNNIVLVETLDGKFNEEIPLDSNSTLITGGEPHEFNNQTELVTYIASIAANKFPAIPAVGEKCDYLKVYAYGTKKAKCVQEHTRMHFAPEETPNLWLIIETITSGYPAWKQPTGAHDAYKIGDKVTYKGGTWESKINANVTVPDGDKPYNRYWKPI